MSIEGKFWKEKNSVFNSKKFNKCLLGIVNVKLFLFIFKIEKETEKSNFSKKS